MLKNMQPYLRFTNAQCQQALDFYVKIFNGQVDSLKLYTESTTLPNIPEHAKNWIVNASFKAGDVAFMACDVLPDQPLSVGNNNALLISIDTTEEADKIFADLAQQGKVLMPFHDVSWGKFGKVTDQFGIMWYVNVNNPA